MTVLLVAVGALVGAPLRYLTDRFVQARHRSVAPLGTLTVNLAASFVLGIVAGAVASSTTSALVGTGLCGTLSTYSTFGFETLRLTRDGHQGWAGANVVVSVLAGVGVAALGWLIGAA